MKKSENMKLIVYCLMCIIEERSRGREDGPDSKNSQVFIRSWL